MWFIIFLLRRECFLVLILKLLLEPLELLEFLLLFLLEQLLLPLMSRLHLLDLHRLLVHVVRLHLHLQLVADFDYQILHLQSLLHQPHSLLLILLIVEIEVVLLVYNSGGFDLIFGCGLFMAACASKKIALTIKHICGRSIHRTLMSLVGFDCNTELCFHAILAISFKNVDHPLIINNSLSGIIGP